MMPRFPKQGIDLRSIAGSIDSWVRKVEPWSILIASVALMVSVVHFFVDHEDRGRAREASAWHVLGIVAPGNSGKIAALEELNRDDGLFCFEGFRGKLSWLHTERENR